MKVLYDPYQMHASAQRLIREGVPMEEFPQSIPRLTEASQNLLSLIHHGNFLTYPSEPIRLAINQCVALEGSRGWHITKLRQAHRIDIVVALAMAAFGAVPRELDPVEYYAHYLPLALR
jgi:phage terminase large subunit-like protein